MSSPSASTPRGPRAAARRRWLQLVADYERSGLTQRAFCERHGLALSSLARWRRRVARDQAVRPPAFVAVTVTEDRSVPAASLRVTLPGGLIVDGLCAANVSVVAALVHAL